MKHTTVWLNRANSAQIHTIGQLHANPDRTPVRVHATMAGGTGAALTVADVAGDEPDWGASDDEYVSWAVKYAKHNGIDVLIPSCRMSALAAAKDAFEAVGCVMVTAATAEVSALLDSKSDTYTYLGGRGLAALPPFRKATTPNEFLSAVSDLTAFGFTPTVKYDRGWSAGSFRVLAKDWPGGVDLVLSSTTKPVARTRDYQTALMALAEEDRMPPLVVMPYMDSPEISVDVLIGAEGVVEYSVARVKNRSNLRTVTTEHELCSVAGKLAIHLGLRYLSNVQFRQLDGEWALLEINPRPAAGSYQGAVAGVNLHWAAVRMALGEELTLPAGPQEHSYYLGHQVFPA
jgi:hypothetical protein